MSQKYEAPAAKGAGPGDAARETVRKTVTGYERVTDLPVLADRASPPYDVCDKSSHGIRHIMHRGRVTRALGVAHRHGEGGSRC